MCAGCCSTSPSRHALPAMESEWDCRVLVIFRQEKDSPKAPFVFQRVGLVGMTEISSLE